MRFAATLDFLSLVHGEDRPSGTTIENLLTKVSWQLFPPALARSAALPHAFRQAPTSLNTPSMIDAFGLQTLPHVWLVGCFLLALFVRLARRMSRAPTRLSVRCWQDAKATRWATTC